MSDDATLTGLGNAYRLGIEEIEKAQSSANLTIDRCTEAVRQIGLAADGSSAEVILHALGELASATLSVESAIPALMAAKTDIEQHLGNKGL